MTTPNNFSHEGESDVTHIFCVVRQAVTKSLSEQQMHNRKTWSVDFSLADNISAIISKLVLTTAQIIAS